MITKRSGKFWGIYRHLQVKIESVTPNLHVLFKKNPAAHSCKLQGIPADPQCAVSLSDDMCLGTGIYCGERQMKSHAWYIWKGHSSTERTSGDVCLKTSPGSYMKHFLTINLWCMVSMTIPNDVRVKTQILICSSWLNLPTLTYKTQLASMWSISCIIEHLTQQQGQHKIEWSMLQKRTFRHFRHVNIADGPSNPYYAIIKRIKTRAAWRPEGSESWENCAAYHPKRSFWQTRDGKCSF
jgi:hypothetical protein